MRQPRNVKNSSSGSGSGSNNTNNNKTPSRKSDQSDVTASTKSSMTRSWAGNEGEKNVDGNSDFRSELVERILRWNQKFQSIYKVQRRLGHWTLSSGVPRPVSTTELYAIKIWHLCKLQKEDVVAITNRVQIVQELQHIPSVLPLVEFLILDQQQPLAATVQVRFSHFTQQGGVDLLQYLLERHSEQDQRLKISVKESIPLYTEKEARDIAKQLLQTLDELHSKHSLVHGNIHPESIFLVRGGKRGDSSSTSPLSSPPSNSHNNNNITVYIAEFGWASKVPPSTTDEFGNQMSGLRTRCGVPAFCPPEMILGLPYRQSLDMWSLGCILFIMLGGYPPFQGEDFATMFRKIRGADFTFQESQFDSVSTPAKKLIADLLNIKPYLRKTAEQALHSEWIETVSNETLSQHNLAESLQCLANGTISRHCIRAAQWSASDLFWDPDVEFPAHLPKDQLIFLPPTAPATAFSTTAKTTAIHTATPSKRETFRDLYKLKREIQSGSTGSVWECEHKQTGQIYAVKISRRVPGIDEYLMYEVALMQCLARFPEYTVKLHQFLEDQNFFYLILDFMGGGDVFGRLLEKGKFAEVDAKHIIWKLLKGIECMHKSGMAHRDIKPQNLLLVSKDDDINVKLSDFGFSRREHTPGSLVGTVGTPSYVAPEVLDEETPYDKRADLWSVGVTAYALLSGYPPFMEENLDDLFDQIKRADYKFHADYWSEISIDAQDFIRNLLVVDPQRRWSVEEALRSAWMKGLEEEKEEDL